MMKPSPNDFTLDVEGVGAFRFAQKTLRVQAAVQCEYERLTEGIDQVSEYFDNLATIMAELKVLAVAVPDGWNIDAMDPEEGDTYQRLFKVWSALRDKRAAFRAGTKKSSEGTGQAA